MFRNNKELWLALLAIIVISGLYAGVILAFQQIPAAGDFFGHFIGIIGFVLMLMTEILYSLRKRSRLASWGSMAEWLRFHIFTGIVGPFMVLLHSAWKFNGLAGVTLLLTIIIVISGFIGRYIFTRIPRTLEGIEVETPVGSLQSAALAQSRRMLALWHTIHIPIGMALFMAAFIHIAAAIYYATLLK